MGKPKLTKAQTRKPYPEFPLFRHASGQWAKKIRGKLHYFGTDPDAALAKYLDQRDDLQAGRTPRAGRDGLTVKELCNRFLHGKGQLLNAGELAQRTFADYLATCNRVADAFGRTRLVDDLAADDFESLRASLASTRGPVALGNEIQRVRVVFKYAYDAGLVDKPIRYGPHFKRPSKKAVRKVRRPVGFTGRGRCSPASSAIPTAARWPSRRTGRSRTIC